MKYLNILIITICMLSCNKKEIKDLKKNTSTDSIRAFHIGTTNKVSGEILGKKYFAFSTESKYVGCITNEKNDTLFKDKSLNPKPEFYDFDEDGVTDILFKGNIKSDYDLVKFDTLKKQFKKVIDFNKFPEPTKIKNSNYYYSYHSSGCADECWDSDLFIIEDYTAIRIGNISKYIDDNGKEYLMICKVNNEMKLVVKKFSQKEINKCEKDKWKFIAEYWVTNYLSFSQASW